MSPVDVTASLLYTDNTNVGPATADASYDGDANHEVAENRRQIGPNESEQLPGDEGNRDHEPEENELEDRN